MKIVVLDGHVENPGDLSWNKIAELGELIVYDRPNQKNPQETIQRIGNAEIVLTNKTPITQEILDACPSIKYISVLATGYDVVDVMFAKKGESQFPMFLHTAQTV